MTQDQGRIVTFYSYKGGTGRTMALANVAWILAASGKRVLVVDWDLESPGLHRFFGPFLDAAEIERTATGVIDIIRDYVDKAEDASDPDQLAHSRYARVNKHSFSIEWEFPGGGSIDFLPAGRLADYENSVAKVSWPDFYDLLAGGLLLEALREDMIRNYDYALIDSRTGLSDVCDICTQTLPDTLVACFTMSEQGIVGTARVVENVQKLSARRRKISILPVLMRVDQNEMDKVVAGAAVAKQHFPGLPARLAERDRDEYWAKMRVPYWPFYAYEETLAVFGDEPGDPRTMLSAYELLTSHITGGDVTRLAPMETAVRLATKERFVRIPFERVDAVQLWYATADAVWGEWVTAVLERAGVTVHDVASGAAATDASASSRRLLIVSQHKPPAELLANGGNGLAPLALRVGDLLPQVPRHHIATVDGDAVTVARNLLALVGRPGPSPEDLASGPRFPSDDTDMHSVPMPDPTFTGRDAELTALRTLFRPGVLTRGGVAAPPVVAIHGLGGLGKTELAKAYAHRFRSAYDVVRWIPADLNSDLDTPLAALATQLELPVSTSQAEAARVVVQALARGDARRRWLLIFDNAEQVERLAPLLLAGKVHVLLTTQLDWSANAHVYELDTFIRADSVAHLQRHGKVADPDEADQIASALDDMPIAIASASQYLVGSGTPTSSYLSDLRRGMFPEDRIAHIWDAPLDKLASTSPTTYRMLQICSVLATDIAQELLTSSEMAVSLKSFDRKVSDRSVLGRLIQELSRFGLVKVERTADERDPGSGRSVVRIHRLLQQVVRGRMEQRELELTQHEAHLILAGAQPYGGELDVPDNGPRYRMIWPHLEPCEAATCWDFRVRQLLVDRTRFFYLRGDTRRGREMADLVERTWVEMLASERDDVDREDLRRQLLQLRFNKANLLRDAGLFAESHKTDTAVYAEQVELLGETHANTLMTSGSLAADLRGLGRYQESLERDIRTHQAWLREEGRDHPRTLNALSNLAVAHRLVGHVDIAERMDEEVFEARKRLLGMRNPNTLLSGGSLGRDLREAGKYANSVELLTSIYEAAIDLDGPESRLALTAGANLAISLRVVGRVTEAVGLLDEACGKLPALVGDGPDLAAARLSRAMNRLELSLLARAADRARDAERDLGLAADELAAVQAEYLQKLGEDHPHHLACLNNSAAVARAQGDLPRARKLASMTVDGFTSALADDDHISLLTAKMNLSICQVELKDLAAGRPLMDEVAERMARVFGADHPLTLRCQINALLAARSGRRTKQTAAERDLLERLSGLLGQSHFILTALRNGDFVHRTIDPHPF